MESSWNMKKRLMNSITVEDNIAYLDIFNKKGEFQVRVKFDPDDRDKVASYTWYYNEYRGYVFTMVKRDGKWRMLALHRYLLNAKEKEYVDHINRDRLDCRKSNLRIVPRYGNYQNYSASGYKVNRFGKKTSSRYRGVCFVKKLNCYRAQVFLNGKLHILGHFPPTPAGELQAAMAAKRFRQKHMKYTQN